MGRRDSSGGLTQFLYALPAKPWLVSHVYQPRESRMTSLVYDDMDRLIFVKINQVSESVSLHLLTHVIPALTAGTLLCCL